MPDQTQLFLNPKVDRVGEYTESSRTILSHSAFRRALMEIKSWPGYQPTPLRALPTLASTAGVGCVWVKDESTRFGLGSFKSLGGSYALFRVLGTKIRESTGDEITSASDLTKERYQDILSNFTATCATSGNHGLSVAWGAKRFGCRSVIYLPAGVAQARERALTAEGAKIVRVAEGYSDAVRRADEDAQRAGRHVISDTAYPGYQEIPRHVMQGFTVLVGEALEQLPSDTRLTHVFVQAGVGGLAAAVCGHLWENWGKERPRFIVVEPRKSGCLYASAVAGKPTALTGNLDTVMSCLQAAEVSTLAWDVLQPGADAFMTIPDDAALDTMRRLVQGSGDDDPVISGASGAAGLAGLLSIAKDEYLKHQIQLDANSKVMLINSEGAIDRDTYENTVNQGTPS